MVGSQEGAGRLLVLAVWWCGAGSQGGTGWVGAEGIGGLVNAGAVWCGVEGIGGLVNAGVVWWCGAGSLEGARRVGAECAGRLLAVGAAWWYVQLLGAMRCETLAACSSGTPIWVVGSAGRVEFSDLRSNINTKLELLATSLALD